MPNSEFLEKGLGMISLPYFPYDFSRKMFLMLYSITDQISQFDSGAQPEIFQGKGGLVGLGHFYKHFVKNTRKKGPAVINLEVFSPRYS